MNLYSEKVDAEDVRNLFNRITKSRFPLFGFIDLSDLFSPNGLTLVIKRNDNTVRFYVKEKDCLQSLSALVFPFKLCETTILKLSAGSFFPIPRPYAISGSRHDILDFMLKESIEQLTLNITKIMGRFIATGTTIDVHGRKGTVAVFSPDKFLQINLEKNPSIYIELLEPLPKQIYMSSNYPVFEEQGMSMGVDNFDPLQHTIIAGTSGSGKSKGLYVLLKALEAKYKDKVRIVIVDPHGEFNKLMPHGKVVNFVSNYVEPLDVGKDRSPMLTQLVSQLIASTIGQENKYSERVLFYTVHLLTSLGKLDLANISLLLTDPSVKAEYVSMCDNDEVKRFFDEEYNDIHMHHFNDAILPILNFIGEYQLYLGNEKKRENLLELIKNNRVTIVSFDPKFFGRKMISFLAGAVINQMYIMAITGKFEDKPTVLVVDEFPRVETRVTKDILAETRKFNLFAYLSCQYLGQLSQEVQDAIVSNARNIIAFKINKQDAALLSSIMEIKVEEYFKKHRATTELEESKKEMFVRLHQRECIVRLFDGTKYLLPMKVKIVDAAKWGMRDGFVPSTGSEAVPLYRQVRQPMSASSSAFTKPYSDDSEAENVHHAQPGSRPLRYSEDQDRQAREPVEYREENGESDAQEAQEEEKRARPELPGPLEDNSILKETPDAIYQLAKSKLEAANSTKPSQPPSPPPAAPANLAAPADGSRPDAPTGAPTPKPRGKKKKD